MSPPLLSSLEARKRKGEEDVGNGRIEVGEEDVDDKMTEGEGGGCIGNGEGGRGLDKVEVWAYQMGLWKN